MNRTMLNILIMSLAIAPLHAQSAGPAARLNDITTHAGHVLEGSPNVLINGQRAARLGDFANCPQFNGLVPHIGGDISSGSSSVRINGLPAARLGDLIIENGATSNVNFGSPNVYIGN